ncbi:hypothetical protein EUTSA_v10023779mg [Eutrema salsugineum]|uniref:Uncharacterized protein n=1 Tax=Eutrema salsugineum TaxID=72664 RepID=V4KQW3_EUTSA|nr:hypothetical protein EUTSA_v10023779mg [Eutrema salsugineum]
MLCILLFNGLINFNNTQFYAIYFSTIFFWFHTLNIHNTQIYKYYSCISLFSAFFSSQPLHYVKPTQVNQDSDEHVSVLVLLHKYGQSFVFTKFA